MSVKISGLRCYVIPGDWKEFVFLILECDDGTIGVGEATITNRGRTTASAIRDISDYLIGRDPGLIESHWTTLYRRFHWRGGAVQMSALAAVDQALWDIAGQVAGLPVHRLLGGACHPRVRTYLNQWYRGARDSDELTERARAAVADGATGLKWYPLRFIELDRQVHRLTGAEMGAAVAEVAAVREAVGAEVDLMVDLSGVIDAVSAVAFCKAIEDLDLLFVEEPAPPENPELLKAISGSVPVRIAAGERRYSRWDFRELIEGQAVGYVQPGVCWAGGITEIRKIAAMAEVYNIGVAPYNPAGPVATAATVHAAATLPNFVIMECYPQGYPAVCQEVMASALVMDGDGFALPEAPGLGVTLDESALRRLAVASMCVGVEWAGRPA